MRLRSTLFVAVLTVVLAGASAWAAPPADLVKTTLIADTTAVQPGRPFKVGVLFKIVPHWHLYWINPGDGGIPTTVELKLPAGFTASPFQYPTPKQFPDAGGLLSYGYEDEVMLIATVTPPTELSGNVTIGAEANWLVCEKTCVPGDAKLSIKLPVGPAQPSEQKHFTAWQARMPATKSPLIDKITQKVVPAEGTEGKVTVEVRWAGAAAPKDVQWFPPPSDAFLFGKPAVETSGNLTTITATYNSLASPAGGDGKKPLESVLAFHAQQEGRGGVVVDVDMNKK